jgi:predicted O-methyltransferase YrrM
MPEFTKDWFSHNIPVWRDLVLPRKPQSVLEIGSFEGMSACYLLENLNPLHIVCVDSWEGSDDINFTDMNGAEDRFDRNTEKFLAPGKCLRKLKGLSREMLPRLLTEGRGFDLAYIDGSHQAPDVLSDAVMAFYLLKIGGMMIFDDYIWQNRVAGEQDHYRMPKPAIDTFLNIFQRKMIVIPQVPLYQLFAVKTHA